VIINFLNISIRYNGRDGRYGIDVGNCIITNHHDSSQVENRIFLA